MMAAINAMQLVATRYLETPLVRQISFLQNYVSLQAKRLFLQLCIVPEIGRDF